MVNTASQETGAPINYLELPCTLMRRWRISRILLTLIWNRSESSTTLAGWTRYCWIDSGRESASSAVGITKLVVPGCEDSLSSWTISAGEKVGRWSFMSRISMLTYSHKYSTMSCARWSKQFRLDSEGVGEWHKLILLNLQFVNTATSRRRTTYYKARALVHRCCYWLSEDERLLGQQKLGPAVGPMFDP